MSREQLVLTTSNAPVCTDLWQPSTGHILYRKASSIAVEPSPSRLPKTRQPLLPFRDDARVVLGSLRKTLDAHREANQTSLITKVTEDGARVPLKPDEASQYSRDLLVSQDERVDASSGGTITVGKNVRKRMRPDHVNQDYCGESRGLLTQWALNSPSQLPATPWTKNLRSAEASPVEEHMTGLHHLTAEIYAFEQYMLPGPAERSAADRAIEDVSSVMSACNPSLTIEVIGSRNTGIAFPFSDVDINIVPTGAADSTGTHAERQKARRMLFKVWHRMRRHHSRTVTTQSFINQARVPIIKALHHVSSLDIQIQCTSGSPSGTTHVKAYLSEFPTLRPLFFVLKHMLAMRGLTAGWNGGISSYPLLIMIIAALKFSDGKMGTLEAGKQLLFILDMYSTMDFYTTGISLSPLEFVSKTDPIAATSRATKDNHAGHTFFPTVNPEQPYLMSLQNPANLDHDLGRLIRLIKHAQAVFIEAHRQVQDAVARWDEEDLPRVERGRKSMLAWCLGADYSLFEQERHQLSRIS